MAPTSEHPLDNLFRARRLRPWPRIAESTARGMVRRQAISSPSLHHAIRFSILLHLMTRDSVERPSVRAPEFPDNVDWINSPTGPVRIADLREKAVLLDFWTYG
jgi:hypothetical protein